MLGIRIHVALTAALLVTSIAPAGAEEPIKTFTLTDEVGRGEVPLALRIAPDQLQVELGEQVAWRNEGLIPHQLDDATGLFSWGPIPPGGTETFRPWAAGTYRFHDRLEPAVDDAGRWDRGAFTVQPYLDPYAGRLRWARQPPPDGFVYDVQRINRTGQRWRWWRRGVTAKRARFQWDTNALVSCIGFRARLRDLDERTRRLGWGGTGVLCVVV